jgi:hypothetical protein
MAATGPASPSARSRSRSTTAATRRRFWFQQPGWRPGIEAEPYKHLSNAARLEALAKDLEFHPHREYSENERQALSREEIAEMAPFVDFGVHTRFHPVLTQCSDEEAWDEIATSKREIEALLGRPCRHFSYPNGDYCDREATFARQAGFASARTVDLGWTHAGSDPYRLKSFGINDDASIDMLATQLSGIPGYVRRLLQGSRGALALDHTGWSVACYHLGPWNPAASSSLVSDRCAMPSRRASQSAASSARRCACTTRGGPSWTCGAVASIATRSGPGSVTRSGSCSPRPRA